jgi:hypothetical protein
MEASAMAKSPRARAAMLAAHPDLFHSVIKVDEHTVVPKEATGASDELTRQFDFDGSHVLCVVLNCVQPVAITSSVGRLSPHYNRFSRELSLADFVLRRFTRRADNQKRIAQAFEEDSQ